MQAGSLHSIQCCHEIYNLLKQKTSEELIGPIDFVFDDLELLIIRRTVSGKLVMLKMGELSDRSKYDMILSLTLFHSEPILTLFIQCKNNGVSKYMNEQAYKNHIWRELTDFFALNYQKFV